MSDELEIDRAPCDRCGDPEGWRGFHRAGCPNKIEWLARREIGAETLKRELLPDTYVGAWSVWRDSATRSTGDAALCGKVRDRIAELKGPEGLAEEVARENAMRCRRCEETEAERAVAGEDYKLPAESVRHEAAHELATWLEAHGLQPTSEAIVDRDASRKYYRVCWASGLVGGHIHVYGDEWVHVSWDGECEHMPTRGSRVFGGVLEAEMFLESAVIDQDWATAQHVPVRDPKDKP